MIVDYDFCSFDLLLGKQGLGMLFFVGGVLGCMTTGDYARHKFQGSVTRATRSSTQLNKLAMHMKPSYMQLVS